VDDAELRVSDADRDQAVIALREHLLAGRLTLEEFSERVEVALQARRRGELASVGADLPEMASSGRKPTRFTAALFGHVVRRGRLRLRRWTCAAAAFGDLDFDLRESAIDHPSTGVTVLAAFGNVDVYVPDGVNVDVTGVTLFGHRRDWGRDAARADAPTVRVHAVGCFATVDVWRVPRDLQGSYGEIFREIERRQREVPR
jgi:Domain of unknown function (DUF1707)/Cell wall-active antibiotics response 4TMS YvqF